MKTPARSAAAIRNSPAPATTARPSMVISTVAPSSAWGAMAWWEVMTGSAMGPGSLGTGSVFDMEQELVAEHPDGRGDGGGDGGAEHADGRLLRRPAHAGGQVVGDVHQQLQVALAAFAVLDPAQDLLEPTAPLATRCALAA